ncbi:substrate-binding domain-containing protein [Streptomyces sp. NBC_01446]|uniref:substrate-binding domain-containing protein n=1 Tax=unclassified Streptomyces TaxID=2593676 RepID=UPI0022537DF5|nr:substrate-binding domain-containing protein [Streptomyces sp. NBC_01446]MCX4641604.1 substrate-binding domain-containing protein [Streptomyces sp. NBC_01446]
MGGKAATAHLLGLGHRRIAYLGGPESTECNQARLHGYLCALTAHGLAPDLLTHGRFRADHDTEGVTALLARNNPPTAIFAGKDAIAVGVLREARRRGIRVPEDLSLLGFDGTALAQDSVPALTPVAQPLQEMRRATLRAVLRQSRGEQPDTHRVELATQFAVRESTTRLR